MYCILLTTADRGTHIVDFALSSINSKGRPGRNASEVACATSATMSLASASGLPIYFALRMSTSPSWAQHAALGGDASQRVAAVRAWAAAFLTYMIVRRGDGVALREAAFAAVDRVLVRIPGNVGIAAPAISRARARARARARLIETFPRPIVNKLEGPGIVEAVAKRAPTGCATPAGPNLVQIQGCVCVWQKRTTNNTC